MTDKNYEYEFTIITLGDCGVGKTSIIKRFSYDLFDEKVMTTVGVGFSYKTITLKNGKKVKLKLMDTAGQEKFKSLTKSFFKNADGVLFVFSLDKEETFTEIKDWIKIFNENNNKSDVAKILVGNKCDLIHKVNKNMIEEFENEYKDFIYEETSAKQNIAIDTVFQKISEELYDKYEKRGNKNKMHLYQKIEKPKEHKNGCLGCGGDLKADV